MAKFNFVTVEEISSAEVSPIIENTFDKRDSVLFKGSAVDLAHLTACLASGKPYHGLPCSKQNVVFWAPFEDAPYVSDVFHRSSEAYSYSMSDVSSVKACADMNYWYMSDFFESLEKQLVESETHPDVIVVSFGGSVTKTEVSTKAAYVKEFMSNINNLINKFNATVIFSFEPLDKKIEHNEKRIEKLNNDIFIKDNVSAVINTNFKTKIGFWHKKYPEYSVKK